MYPLRDRYQYNNYMYVLAGFIVEKLGGDTWEKQLKEKIFDPLGMTSSGILRYAEDIRSTDVSQPYFFNKKDSVYFDATPEAFKYVCPDI